MCFTRIGFTPISQSKRQSVWITLPPKLGWLCMHVHCFSSVWLLPQNSLRPTQPIRSISLLTHGVQQWRTRTADFYLSNGTLLKRWKPFIENQVSSGNFRWSQNASFFLFFCFLIIFASFPSILSMFTRQMFVSATTMLSKTVFP